MSRYSRSVYGKFLLPLLVLFIADSYAIPANSQSVTVQSSEIPVIRNESGPVCDGPVFDLIPERVIGRDSGRPEWQIFPRSVGVLAVGPDERLYIRTSDSIIYISTTRGRLLGQFGGLGEGPGEYSESSYPFWIESDRELWINDLALFRLTRFSIDGELLGITSYHELADDWRYLIHLRDRRFLGERTAHENERTFQIYGLLDDDMNWSHEVVRVMSPDPSGRAYSPRPGLMVGLPYQPAYPWIESFPDGRFVLINAEEGSLAYFSVEGTPLFKVQDCFELPKITREDRDRYLARIEARTPEYLPAARRVRFPDTMGAYTRSYGDDSGRLWLQQQRSIYNADGEPIAYNYVIVDRNGRLLGTQTFEFEAHSIEIRDDYLYWSDNGGEDIGPRIRVYRLEPRFN
ncbi:hypothetical protein ACFL6T_00995 [Candidatus Zixiibacteriota bacterium]